MSGLVSNGLVTPEQAEICATYLSIVQTYEALVDADFIFECVAESVEVKYAVYAQIEAHCHGVEAVMSTSSAMSAKLLAEGFQSEAFRARLVVAHPFNPPHLVPLVEVVRSPYVDDSTIRQVVDFLESLGRKTALLNRDARGFIANRLQHALLREAIHIVEQGIATPEDIDRTLMYSFMPRYTSIGLFEHQDNAGLDLIDNIHKYLFEDLSTAQTTQPLITDRVACGDLGIKTGRGIYDWSKKDLTDFYARAGRPYLRFFDWKLPQAKRNETPD